MRSDIGKSSGQGDRDQGKKPCDVSGETSEERIRKIRRRNTMFSSSGLGDSSSSFNKPPMTEQYQRPEQLPSRSDLQHQVLELQMRAQQIQQQMLELQMRDQQIYQQMLDQQNMRLMLEMHGPPVARPLESPTSDIRSASNPSLTAPSEQSQFLHQEKENLSPQEDREDLDLSLCLGLPMQQRDHHFEHQYQQPGFHDFLGVEGHQHELSQSEQLLERSRDTQGDPRTRSVPGDAPITSNTQPMTASEQRRLSRQERENPSPQQDQEGYPIGPDLSRCLGFPTQQRNEHFDQQQIIKKLKKTIVNSYRQLNKKMEMRAKNLIKEDYDMVCNDHHRKIHSMKDDPKKHNDLIALMKEWAEEGNEAQKCYAKSFWHHLSEEG